MKVDDPKQLSGILNSYGTTCIITEVELPLAPSQNWMEVLVAFDSEKSALEFCLEVGYCPTVDKKSLSCFQWPFPAFLPDIRDLTPSANHVVILTVAYGSHVHAINMATEFKGHVIRTDAAEFESLVNYSWNYSLKVCNVMLCS